MSQLTSDTHADDREATRLLWEALATLYPDLTGAQRIVEDAGLPTDKIDFSGSALNRWRNIFVEVEKVANGVERLSRAAQREYGSNPPLIAAINKLKALAPAPAPSPSQPQLSTLPITRGHATGEEAAAPIAALEERLLRFEQLERSFQALSAQRGQLDASKVNGKEYEQWRLTEVQLEHKLNQIAPEAETFDELANEIAAQSQVLRQYLLDNPTHVKEQLSRSAMAPAESSVSGEPGLFLPGLSATDAYQPNKAQTRLLQYAWLFYILSAGALVAVGMSTIYVPNPTFGANTLSDYFTLFVFGLGGQTTLASVTELLQKWGLPWGK